MLLRKNKYDLKHIAIVFLWSSLMCFQLMPFALISINIILLSVLLVIFYWKSFSKKNINVYIYNVFFVILMILTLSYSTNIKDGLKEIQKILPILILPLLIISINIKFTREIHFFKRVFVFSNLVYIIYMYSFFVKKLTPYKVFKLRQKPFLYRFYKVFQIDFGEVLYKAINVSFERPPLLFHRTYMSMFLLLSILILLNTLRRKQHKLAVFLNIILICFFTIVLFHWVSVPNIIAFLILVPLNIILLCYKNKYFRLTLVMSFILAAFLVINTNNNVTVNNKMNQLKDFVQSPITKTKTRAGRSQLNYCGVSLVKNNFVKGYGVGSVQDNLNICYKTEGFQRAFKDELNTHNYFLHLFLVGGVLLFLSFIFMLLFNFNVAIKKKDLLYFSFLLLICFNAFSENILYRAHGVLFFSLFNTLFLSRNVTQYQLNQHTTNTLNDDL